MPPAVITAPTARRSQDGSGSNPQIGPAMIRPVSPAKRPVADSTRMRSQSFGARSMTVPARRPSPRASNPKGSPTR